MSENDKGSLPKELDLSKFKWVKNGDIIDIGGGRSFEVIELPTHSKGQLVFLDKADGLAATGDAVGSGSMVWVFGVPFKDLSVYLDALKYTENKMKGLKGLTLMVGHHYQEKVPLTGLNGLQLFTDMRVLTQKVLAGEIIGDIAYQVRNGRVTELRQSYYGLAGLWYNPR
jgi:glyoxylase-like metal-dependent hydrolase (beta-lactamase superfamily II)